MKKIYTSLVFILFFNVLNAQITFQKTYGGTSVDVGNSVQQTTDGGYIITGLTESFGAGLYEVYAIKTDSIGDTLWTRTFGGFSSDQANSVRQTTDGGYIICGWTSSFGAGYEDIYLIKTDSVGASLWTKTIGSIFPDYGFDVQQTSDGGYIITGCTRIFPAVDYDVYLIKTDINGDTLWTKFFSGTCVDIGYSVQQTSDGGYIITGETCSFGTTGSVFYLIKTDTNGNLLWSKTFGINSGYGKTVEETTDGGYIIAGYAYGGSSIDVYLIKTNPVGNILWVKTFDCTDNDRGYSVQQTTDGGFIISGQTGSSTITHDVYLIKTDANGDSLWTKTYGGALNDAGYSVQQTSDDGYIITGFTLNFGTGDANVYLIKTDSLGNSGCNQGIPAAIVSSAAMQVSIPASFVFSGGIVNNPVTIVGNGGAVTTPCIPVGVQSEIPNPQSTISLSPNPADEYSLINYQFAAEDVLRVTDVMGKAIFTKTFSAPTLNFRLQTLNFNAGIYYVEVISEKEKLVRKMVKQ